MDSIDKEALQDELKELEEAGVIKKVSSRDGVGYEFTEDGWDFSELAISTSVDMQLTLFRMMWNNRQNYSSDHKKLMKIAKDLQKNPGINILRTLELHQDRLEGIKLKELPESLLEKFDP